MNAISKDLVKETLVKALNLIVKCFNPESNEIIDYERQAGVVFDRSTVPFLVTAKHNVVSEIVDGDMAHAQGAQIGLPNGKSAPVSFAGMLRWELSNSPENQVILHRYNH
jgi:hypothetical protein